MANKHIFKDVQHLTNREMQITMRYQYIPKRMTKIKNIDTNNTSKDAEQLELSYIAGGTKMVQPHGKQFGSFLKS